MHIGQLTFHQIAGLGKNGGEGIIFAQQTEIVTETVPSIQRVSLVCFGGDSGKSGILQTLESISGREAFIATVLHIF